jgi:radical SAM superfamily enzyme YgiQ (UPF0313 family)
VRNIKIADEMFVLNRKHVSAICQGLIDRGYDLNIWAYARVDTMGDGMADLMRQAGITWLAFGIEAASARVRDNVDKGYAQQDIFQSVERVRTAGSSVVANYIFGLPEDDAASMQDTLSLALSLNAEYANFYCTMAYPGSALYTQALQQGWPLPNSWSGYSQHSVDSTPLPTRYLAASDVLAFRDHAFQRYFTDPGYLQMMQQKFGDDAVAHVRHMTGQRLVRKIPNRSSMPAPLLSFAEVPPLEILPLTRGES